MCVHLDNNVNCEPSVNYSMPRLQSSSSALVAWQQLHTPTILDSTQLNSTKSWYTDVQRHYTTIRAYGEVFENNFPDFLPQRFNVPPYVLLLLAPSTMHIFRFHFFFSFAFILCVNSTSFTHISPKCISQKTRQNFVVCLAFVKLSVSWWIEESVCLYFIG